MVTDDVVVFVESMVDYKILVLRFWLFLLQCFRCAMDRGRAQAIPAGIAESRERRLERNI